jgi:phosphoglycerate-specific signal transduction histidine kinase
MSKESKLLKFEHLAEKRTSAAIKALRLVGNLANTNNYSYTQEHVNQILAAIKKEIKELEAKFQQKNTQGYTEFQFRSSQS